MKKTSKLFLSFLLLVLLVFSGCSLLPDIEIPGSQDDELRIKSFEFILDEQLQFKNNYGEEYFGLDLFCGEKYQIKTNVDDELGSDYYFKYYTDDETYGMFTISENGLIETNNECTESNTFVIKVDLYKKGSSSKIKREYIIFSLTAEEYARIKLLNENLTFDESTSTYSLTIPSGNSFNIQYNVQSNIANQVVFSLVKISYESFMQVDSEGKITTTKTSEDKIGEISIKLVGASGKLDEVFLKVYLEKSDETINTLEVINLLNGQAINSDDVINIYKNQELSFDIKYNNQIIKNVITTSDSNLIEVISETNTIKAISTGSCQVSFKYEEEVITVTVNISNDILVSIDSLNFESSFIIINDKLLYLDKMYAKYKSKETREIKDTSLIITTIMGENETYKTVEFTYTEDGVTARIVYDVKYYVVNEYNEIESSYDANDYLNNSIYGEIYALPNEGVVKVLVIPVWFSDSDEFFTSNQQAQIIEDITYTMIGDRPDNELPSVEQYYETQSYGQIDMEITISEFYYSSTSYKDYTDYIESKRPNTYVLGTNAINWYFENHLDEKFSDYDLNNDGFLDGLILYYGANYYGASSDNNRSVAFQSSNTDIKYNYNSLCFCPIGGLYGLGKQDLSSQLEATDLSSTYSRTFRSSSRTVIHEIGHMFGNDDLYEEQFASYRYSPAGGFNMQEDNYGGFDPYHLNKIGWTKPQVYASSDYNLGDKVKIYLSDFQSSGQNIILTNKWNEFDSIYDEYLILELFAPTGVNKYDWKVTHLNMLETGIRLWHVNSLLLNYNDGTNTSEIISGNQYDIISSNYNVDNKYDLVHMIRNNPDEEYNTLNNVQSGGVLFKEGDSFDMETFSSQFINGAKLDNEEKLGWNFTIDELFENSDGTYGAIITLERVDNEKTDFKETVTLNRSDLDTPDGVEDYSSEIFGEDGDLTFIYKLVTPPSVYNQNYPISSNGMCLFASEDGNGGYIELSLKDVEGKDVIINSITITYSYLTNASLTVITNGNIIEGTKIESIMSDGYTYTYDVNSSQVIIQNMYNEIINHWSVIALYEITIEYTIK